MDRRNDWFCSVKLCYSNSKIEVREQKIAFSLFVFVVFYVLCFRPDVYKWFF